MPAAQAGRSDSPGARRPRAIRRGRASANHSAFERLSIDAPSIEVDRRRLSAVAAAANDSAAHPNTRAAALEFPEGRLWTDGYSNLFQALRDKSRVATR